MTVKNIVFDLGGVLVDWNPRYLYRKVFDSEEKVTWFLENICTNQWNGQQDAGRTLNDATELLVEKKPEYTNEIRAYYQRWTEMLNGPIEGTLNILKQLRAQNGHRLLALTNWSQETFPTALEIFEFLHWFEGIVVSGDEKLIKPDPGIYQILFERYQIEPHESVFIDDSLPNVIASRELGMHALHFKGPEQLARELKELKVIQ